MQEAPEMRPMTLEQLARKLADKKLKIVAKRTGLHYNTLRGIKNDPDANPTLNVMKALSAYLRSV